MVCTCSVLLPPTQPEPNQELLQGHSKWEGIDDPAWVKVHLGDNTKDRIDLDLEKSCFSRTSFSSPLSAVILSI